jgi:hypothetical protein
MTTCTVPMDIKLDEYGKPYYELCGEVAVARSTFNKDWCFCKAHAATATDEEKWEIEPIK